MIKRALRGRNPSEVLCKITSSETRRSVTLSLTIRRGLMALWIFQAQAEVAEALIEAVGVAEALTGVVEAEVALAGVAEAAKILREEVNV
jgi:hypothetical protein